MKLQTIARIAAKALDQRVARATHRTPRSMPLLYAEVIKACNLRCVMCGFPSHYPDRGALLSTGEWLAVIDDAASLGAEVVSFGGGEPFLREDLLTLIEAVGRRGMAMHVNTNGTRIPDEVADQLADAAHLHLALSLDHCDPKTNDAIRGKGVHEAVQRASETLRRRAPAVGRSLNVVVGGHSSGSLRPTVELAARWGMEAIKFQPVHANLAHAHRPQAIPSAVAVQPGQVQALAAELQSARHLAVDLGLSCSSGAFIEGFAPFWQGSARLACYAGYLYGNVDPFGFFGPCYDHMTPLNVREIGLKAAWEHAQMQQARQQVKACRSICWNNGNAEPSLRLSAHAMLREPAQVGRDMRLNLRAGR